jgi:hypothetical protein
VLVVPLAGWKISTPLSVTLTISTTPSALVSPGGTTGGVGEMTNSVEALKVPVPHELSPRTLQRSGVYVGKVVVGV